MFKYRKTINVFLLKANFDHGVFKKVSPNDCDNDRQTEIAIWLPV